MVAWNSRIGSGAWYLVASLFFAIGTPLDFHRMAISQGVTDPPPLIVLGLLGIVSGLPLMVLITTRGPGYWNRFLLSRSAVALLQQERLALILENKKLTGTLRLNTETGPGFIYIMRRADGIYKIGRSTDPGARLIEHIRDYKQGFTLIRIFAVPDMAAFEQLALRRTKGCAYKKEAGRRELRKMTKGQLSQFMVEFKKILKQG